MAISCNGPLTHRIITSERPTVPTKHAERHTRADHRERPWRVGGQPEQLILKR